MDNYSSFKLVKNDGVTTIIINRNRILVAKRINFPLISDSGLWNFIAGHRERNESYEENAYREIFEETKIRKEDLALISSHQKVMKVDFKKRIKYYNSLYVFRSRTDKAKLNIENTRYRWAPFSDIKNHKEYTNIFADEKSILGIIKKAIGK